MTRGFSRTRHADARRARLEFPLPVPQVWPRRAAPVGGRTQRCARFAITAEPSRAACRSIATLQNGAGKSDPTDNAPAVSTRVHRLSESTGRHSPRCAVRRVAGRVGLDGRPAHLKQALPAAPIRHCLAHRKTLGFLHAAWPGRGFGLPRIQLSRPVCRPRLHKYVLYVLLSGQYRPDLVRFVPIAKHKTWSHSCMGEFVHEAYHPQGLREYE